MADELNGKKIAIIATDGVEQVELVKPREAVEAAGAETVLLSIEDTDIQAMNSDIEPADTFTADKLVGDVSPDDFDGLILPGGTVNADKLRADDDVIDFVQGYFKSGKPVGVICHGAVDAGRGRPREGPDADVLSLPADRHPQRRRQRRRRGGRRRPGARVEPQPG